MKHALRQVKPDYCYPEETVRREAEEEAGVRLGRLERVAGYYSSPVVATLPFLSLDQRRHPNGRMVAGASTSSTWRAGRFFMVAAICNLRLLCRMLV